MSVKEFGQKMEAIYATGKPTNITHEDADDLIVEELESLGYDMSIFKEADKWYD